MQTGANFTAKIAKCENWDLYPYGGPKLVDIANVYTGCPGQTWFCINTENATYYTFYIYNYGGEKVFDSGLKHITSNSTCIWDGRYKNGYTLPLGVLSYYLYLYRDANHCATEVLTKGNITPFVYCGPPPGLKVNDQNSRGELQETYHSSDLQNHSELQEAELDNRLKAGITTIGNKTGLENSLVSFVS